MKHIVGILAFVVATAVIVTAAPSSLQITFNSDPQAASLYEGGGEPPKPMGTTPLTLKYKVTKGFSSGKECMTIQPLTARWISGAVADLPNVNVCPANGGKQQFTFIRPDVQGRDMDVQYLLQLQQLALQTRALNEQARQARVAELRRRFALLYPPVRCRSYVIGTSVYTDCQ